MTALKDSTIIICSIVRDAERSLKVNLPKIDNLCNCFKDYKIVIYENDSKDRTKSILRKWAENDVSRKHVLLNNTDKTKSIPNRKEVTCNPFFSSARIKKMARLRNYYMEYIETKGWSADYLMVVDLDVARLYVKPIIEALSEERAWDVLTAYGYSLSPKLKKRYHDGYALTKSGEENIIQTEDMIYSNSEELGKLSSDKEWLKVYSAFGGLAIYKFNEIKDLRYLVLPNNDKRVEVRCEHFSICKQLHEKGFHNIYVVPSMILKYQSITPRLIFNTIKRKLEI